jgi:hypothetical protein
MKATEIKRKPHRALRRNREALRKNFILFAKGKKLYLLCVHLWLKNKEV